MPGPIDAIMSVVPEKWRKEAALIVCGGAIAVAYMTFDARVADAERAAKEQPQLKQQISDLQGNMSVIRQETSDIHQAVMQITGALLGQNAVGHGAMRTDAPTAKPSP